MARPVGRQFLEEAFSWIEKQRVSARIIYTELMERPKLIGPGRSKTATIPLRHFQIPRPLDFVSRSESWPGRMKVHPSNWVHKITRYSGRKTISELVWENLPSLNGELVNNSARSNGELATWHGGGAVDGNSAVLFCSVLFGLAPHGLSWTLGHRQLKSSSPLGLTDPQFLAELPAQ